ncbi:CBP4 domain-containing protein [Verticillium alfalfae VaMs.102]|uniref:Cytochrome b mRNA-processing protein 4 n=1 Tax=Verticillium alfalfae (strain VaMs.102 / ATCC MYA-4576 / FGSC 10136) TaxID=526221 RepID=C9SC66_VERA1|nr:CBP4 domain-containing protein [Verticillium alfalfae VaMs.102]EEY15950.1 CBP4 domain-containing protein [Verticillium alfalfae VaMs.102]
MPKPFNWRLWTKMAVGGGVCVVGGPAFTMWLTPTEEELFKRYNPDLQKRSLERREQTQQEFDQYVGKLKELSKSNKPLWTAWEDEIKAKKETDRQAHQTKANELALQQEAMRREAGVSK